VALHEPHRPREFDEPDRLGERLLIPARLAALCLPLASLLFSLLLPAVTTHAVHDSMATRWEMSESAAEVVATRKTTSMATDDQHPGE
jgi:hypothetical protein